MELRVENFTPGGNNLKWLQPFENFQKEKCNSKSKIITANKNYYNRMLNVLTDNRSIDVLNKESLMGVTKLPEKELIIKYIQSVSGKLSVPQIVDALMSMVPVQENTTAGEKFLAQLVIRELSGQPEVKEQITVSINSEPVIIEASPEGVKVIDKYAGVRRTAAAIRAAVGEKTLQAIFERTEEGTSYFTDPVQMPVPTDLPEPVLPVSFNREAMPNTNELARQTASSQTEFYYPTNEQRITAGPRGTLGQFATAFSPPRTSAEYKQIRSALGPVADLTKEKVIQTILSGDFGQLSPSKTGLREGTSTAPSIASSERSVRRPTEMSGVQILKPPTTVRDMAEQFEGLKDSP